MKNFKSGIFIQQAQYKSFQPSGVNRAWELDDMELVQLLGKADRAVGRLDMYSEYIPNIDLFIRMHVLKEATQSSRIEGTQTNMEEALQDKQDIALEKRDDWEEVQNYISAMNDAIGQLEQLPFATRLICDTHKTLMQGVRGRHKLPGEFRKSQNWIGGASISDAEFIPPIHHSIDTLMSDLEKFVHNEDIYFPELLKIALVHYQFETIHPFLDGNGRVGRLLITLYLVNKGLLKKPILYLSDFFEQHRQLYYDNLMNVRTKNNLKKWFKFFLVGVIETAKNSSETFDKLLKLQQQVDMKIQTLGSRSANAQKVIHYLFQHPLINAGTVATATNLSAPPAYRLVADLERLGILEEITGNKRSKSYLFKEYFDLFS